MIVKTLFHYEGKLEPAEVEVKLLPGIPHLHFVGLPDASIKECGLKLKSALRSSGLKWPAGQQIVVSLRPMDLRKSGAGIDLAVGLAYLAVTGQLAKEVKDRLSTHVVYGELALNGQVLAPLNLAQALRAAKDTPLITGQLQREVRQGRWLELSHMTDKQLNVRETEFDYQRFWQRPPLPNLQIHESAARDLLLSLHLRLAVLVAGPQGSGKTTWARLLHSLMPPPDPVQMNESALLFGEEIWETRWRPLEHPHHTLTTQAMIGGGRPLEPGVITRAHGGLLIMDEFLEFPHGVLEALREPMESGCVTLARNGRREKFSADFQLVATTNLCPCGKLVPGANMDCGFALGRCRSVTQRLSGPLLDRFDFMVLSHEWLLPGKRVAAEELLNEISALQEFVKTRGPRQLEVMPWLAELGLSHRRQRSVAKVARGLADLDRSMETTDQHYKQAFDLCCVPMYKLREIFA
jgi:magnesium chelatase family protein